MYAAEVDGHDERLNFQVSGMLWQRSLVMRDLETETLWSHLLGEAMQGKLKGTSLEVIPSTITTWKKWLADHPKTTVLAMSRTSRDFRRNVLDRPEQFVYGTVHEGTAAAVPLAILLKKGSVSFEVEGLPLTAVADPKSGGTFLWNRQVGEQVVKFNAKGQSEDGTQWNLQTGEATSGPRQGTKLSAAPGILSFAKAWVNFHPESEVIE